MTSTKKSLQQEIMDKLIEKLMEKLQDTVNQKVQDALKKFEDTTNKELAKTQKQLNELRVDFNKHQHEAKETIEKKIYEVKKTTQDMKERFQRYGKTSEKKNQMEILEMKIPFSQINNTVEGHSSRLEQVEDRISGLEDKMDTKEKTEHLVKQLSSCERKMQEQRNFIKRSNLRITGMEEEEMQAKVIHNIFNKIIAENFPNLEKNLPL
jgi:hypothetical protein